MKLNIGVEMKKIHINPVHSEKSLIADILSTDKSHHKILQLPFQISAYYKSQSQWKVCFINDVFED